MVFSKKLKIISKTTSTKSSVILNNYQILSIYQIDGSCFVQGVYYQDGKLYLSCGGYHISKLMLYNLLDDSLQHSLTYKLNPMIFAEGITIIDDLLYLLTWKQRLGYVYKLSDHHLQLINTFTIDCEGWGLTHDSNGNLIISNGSDTLLVLDRETYVVIRSLKVKRDGLPVNNINALAFHNNCIYANIWYQNDIIVIDETTGTVVKSINLSQIVNDNSEGVLNGITFINNKLLVTGKNWKRIYRLDIFLD